MTWRERERRGYTYACSTVESVCIFIFTECREHDCTRAPNKTRSSCIHKEYWTELANKKSRTTAKHERTKNGQRNGAAGAGEEEGLHEAMERDRRKRKRWPDRSNRGTSLPRYPLLLLRVGCVLHRTPPLPLSLSLSLTIYRCRAASYAAKVPMLGRCAVLCCAPVLCVTRSIAR